MRKISKRVLALLLAAVMLLPLGIFSENPFVQEAAAAVAYPKIEAMKVPRIYQPSSDEIGMCHFNSIACLIAYKKGSYTYGTLSRTYSYGTDYAYSSDPIWNKMFDDCNQCYDPILNDYYTKYPGNIVTETVTGNNNQTYKIIYEQLSKGNPVVVYGTGSPNHASVVIGYSADTNSLEASKFCVMQITKSGNYWPNSKTNFDTYANSPTTSHSKSCYLTLSSWMSYNNITLTRISYYKNPSVEIDKSYSKYSISESNAVLCGKVMNPKLKALGNCGIKLYDESGNLLKECKESISNLSSHSVVNLYYDVNKELKYTLKKGTKYMYQFFAVINGTTYYSATETFTTKGANTLSVYYNANGGSISSDTYYLSSNNIYKKSDSSKFCQKWTYNNAQKDGLYNAATFGLSRDGYEFVGWSTTSSGELWFDQNDTGLLPTHLNSNIVNGDCSVTLYAVWKKSAVTAYTLSYNANGGSGAPSSQSGATSYTVSSTKPTRSGYTFLGWATSSTATSASYAGGDTITLSSNTTLYAVWKESKYTVTFYGNGGSGVPDAETFNPGESVTISEFRPFYWGYTFMGWSETADFSSPVYYPGDEVYFDGNTDLIAIWTEHYAYQGYTGLDFSKEQPYFCIKFVPEKTDEYVIKTTTVYDTVDTVGYLVNSNGETIVGDDDSGEDSNFKISYNFTKGQTYCIYITTYNNEYGNVGLTVMPTAEITYDANGGYGAPNKSSHDIDYYIPYDEPYRDGYAFAGWSEYIDAVGASYYPGDDITVTEDTTLYAVWYKGASEFYVYYDANGGTNAPQTMFIESNAIGYIPDEEPVRNGYVFVGWCENTDGNGNWYYPGNMIRQSGEQEDITLYAIWEKIGSSEDPNPDDGPGLPGFLTIRTPSVTVIKYGDTIKLHADMANISVTGLKVTWEANNDNFEIVSVSENGSECVITPKKSGNTTFTATIKVGNSILGTDTQVMTSKAGFFDKIIAFFRGLFGLLKDYEQAIAVNF